MNNFSLFILLVLLILIIIYIHHSTNIIEKFEDKFDDFEKYDDHYDDEFVNLYEIIYRDYADIDYDTKIVSTKVIDNVKNKDDIQILVAGCGVGKLVKKLKDKYRNTIGVDISENMLKKAQILYPNIKFVRGNICKDNIFEKQRFSHIYIDERTLYYNHNNKNNSEQNIENIIKNCCIWLKENGFLIVQIYDPEKLQVASRYYSSNYMDNKKNIHGYTYLNDFSHDCYYIKDDKVPDMFHYYDKVILDNNSKRIKKTTFTIPSKEKIYDIILMNGFDIFYIEKIRIQIVGGYELAIFRKKKTIMSVDEIEKKK